MKSVAIVTARAARGRDEDLDVLTRALAEVGIRAVEVDWDDEGAEWGAYDLALIRSTWDYTTRLAEFLRFVDRASALTQVHNGAEIIRWNTDKSYLRDLAKGGIETVPTEFVEVGDDAELALALYLRKHAAKEVVVKPAVGAGSRDVQRYSRDEKDGATAHIHRLLVESGRRVLLQPYLEHVDREGESALVFFDGVYSHSIRKGAMLRPGGEVVSGLFAEETITAREAAAEELEIARRTIAALPNGAPLYARVDLIRSEAGKPCVLELELTEPSLFLGYAPNAASRFAQAIAKRAGSK